MIIIAAPTRIRAALYAAGLGCADSQWVAATTDFIPQGTTIHLLPGTSPEAVANAYRSAANCRVIDHTI